MASIRNFAETYWWATLLAVLLVVWSWRAWRRQQQTATRVYRPHSGEPLPGVFRRSDFEAKVAHIDRVLHKSFWVVGLQIFVGLPVLMVLKWAAPTLHHAIFPADIYILLAVVMVSVFAIVLTTTRLARRIGLVCAGCQLSLVGTVGIGMPSRRFVDVVLTTGKCPKCRSQLLDEREIGPASATLPRDHSARNPAA